MDEFGINSEIFWLPDSFGVSASIPQILKGCGIKYFMNAKIVWLYNEGDVFPHNNFIWKGIDGSEILSHIISGYADITNPAKIIEKWGINHEKEDVPIFMFPFGWGDGGGGATHIHTELLEREKNLEGMPKVINESPVEFYKELEKCNIGKTYVGELYYAAHRGTYTSQAKTKKLNRQSEFLLREAELWSVFFDKNTKLDTDVQWKKVLFNQFHDIIPGSSITEVHQLSEQDYEEVISKTTEIKENVLRTKVDNAKNSITLFNSLGWNRNVCFELPDGYTSVENCETQKVGDKILAIAEVPAMGYKSFKLGNEKAFDSTSAKELILENEFILAKFNEKGELESIVSKENGMEFLSCNSNVFRMYQDMPTLCDAWDIDSFYESTEIVNNGETTTEKEYTGPLYSSIIVTKEINNSVIKQKIILRKGSRHLDFETEVDWKETHKLLKVDFNTNIHTEELLSEIQFGYIKRPNHKNRQYDADRFEVWQHKWSALAEGRRGFAVLNDCKYGIGADGNRMSLTLLKSAADPALNADKGKQIFTYSVMLFNENIADSYVVRNAYEINCPVSVQRGYAEEKGFLYVEDKNIIVDTVKFAEDNSGDIIVRLYECMGSYTNTTLNFGFDIDKVYKTDMLEQISDELVIDKNNVNLEFKTFEVVTLKIKK